VTNASDEKIEAAAVVFGGSLVRLGDLAAGQTVDVDLPLGVSNAFGLPLSERLFGSSIGGDPARDRVILTRRTVIDQMTAYSGKFANLTASIGSEGAVLIGWRSGTTLPVDIGDEKAAQVGEALYLLPLNVRLGGRTVFPDELIHHTVISADAGEAFDQGQAFSLGTGSMTVEFAPISFSGEFRPTGLTLGMTQGEQSFVPVAAGDPTPPLPPDRQPPQDDPAGASPPADQPFDGVPAFQLLDRTTGLWMEFAHLGPNSAVRIAEPERYVDTAGRFLVRFVSRGVEGGGSVYFSLSVAMEGTIP
jgi:hypothetical protein